MRERERERERERRERGLLFLSTMQQSESLYPAATSTFSIALDSSTTEGRTLKQFCSNFSVLEQNPATLVMNVRQFIDDLRAYIMEKHYKELSKLLVEASSVRATSTTATPTPTTLHNTPQHNTRSPHESLPYRNLLRLKT